jgi:hypothetical protein
MEANHKDIPNPPNKEGLIKLHHHSRRMERTVLDGTIINSTLHNNNTPLNTPKVAITDLPMARRDTIIQTHHTLPLIQTPMGLCSSTLKETTEEVIGAASEEDPFRVGEVLEAASKMHNGVQEIKGHAAITTMHPTDEPTLWHRMTVVMPTQTPWILNPISSGPLRNSRRRTETMKVMRRM